MKLFNLGLPKSGTSTLQIALRKAGISSVHWRAKSPRRVVGRSLYQNYFEARDPLADFFDFQAITQADYVSRTASYWPQMDFALLQSVQEHHPECKFLLLTREPEKIANSIERWLDLRDRLNAVGAPGLPRGFALKAGAIETWAQGHFENVREHYGDRRNFIEIDIDDAHAQTKLENFIEVKLPWWGKANENLVARAS